MAADMRTSQLIKDAGKELKLFDDFDDESLSTSIWGTAVVTGSTTVTEPAAATNTLRIYNPGTGTFGYGYVPSIHTFGRNVSVRSKIYLHSTVNCFARIELYEDADDYIYFGARKDGTADSRVYLWYNIAGAGATTVDINTTNTDNIAREYRIDVTDENILFYVDDILVYTIKDAAINTFYVRPYAESFINANVLDIRFDYVKVLTLEEEERISYKKLLQIQGGTDSIGTIVNALNSSLDLGYMDGTIVADGTEQTIYDDSDDTSFIIRNVDIDCTNMAADSATDAITVRKYKKVKSGGSYIMSETTNHSGVQTVPLKIVTGLGEGAKYGAKVTIEQTTFDGVKGAAIDDGGVFADETADANSAAANDVTLYPAAPVLNDAFYIGGSNPFQHVQINVGTAGNDDVSDWVVTWEYWTGAAWSALSGVIDATTGFTVAGSNSVTFTEPSTWGTTNDGGNLPAVCYWIRSRISTAGGGGVITQPLGTQIWIYPDYEYAIYDEMA